MNQTIVPSRRKQRLAKCVVAALGLVLCLVLLYRDGWIRSQVVSGAGGLLGTSAVPYLSYSLRDSHPEVHNAATDTLKRLGMPAVPLLIPSISDPGTPLQTRIDLVQILGVLGDRAAESAPCLLEVVHDPDARLRGAAICALGFVPCDDEEMTAALESTARDSQQHVRSDALLAAQNAWQSGRKPQIAPIYRRALRDGQSAIRIQAADALGELLLDDVELTNALKELLDDPNPEVRSEAEEALEIRAAWAAAKSSGLESP